MKKTRHCAAVLSSAMAICLMQSGLTAKPVSKEEAQAMAQVWAGGEIKETRPIYADGAETGSSVTICYLAQPSRGGFVILSAVSELPPVVAFSDEAFNPKKVNLFKRFVTKDMEQRFKNYEDMSSDEKARNQALWNHLLKGVPFEPRVEPLVESNWGQTKAGQVNVFNRFTPEINDPNGSGEMIHTPCGSVASAMAQLMRYHQWPKAGIGVKGFDCQVEEENRHLETRGGDGQGGAYYWNHMPLHPGSDITTTQATMIGALTYDAGVAIGTKYREMESTANVLNGADALKHVFSFGNAIKDENRGESLVGRRDFLQKVNANLEARLPVMFGILGDTGQGVLCDGYCYKGSLCFHHLNMGWDGGPNVWYHVGAASSGVKQSTTISKLIYNIFTKEGGECVSGRVLDHQGQPVADAVVTLGDEKNTRTDANGIFGFAGVASGSYFIKAEKESLQFDAKEIQVNESRDFGKTGNLCGLTFRAL